MEGAFVCIFDITYSEVANLHIDNKVWMQPDRLNFKILLLVILQMGKFIRICYAELVNSCLETISPSVIKEDKFDFNIENKLLFLDRNLNQNLKPKLCK